MDYRIALIVIAVIAIAVLVPIIVRRKRAAAEEQRSTHPVRKLPDDYEPRSPGVRR